jgi:DNA-binding response OmpR family regulator
MPASAPPLTGRRILVVEDEYLIAVEVKRWLQAAGAVVLGPVPSVHQALDLIEDDGVDAAVLDVNLGDGDTAYPVADKLGSLSVPYLFATGDVRATSVATEAGRPRLEKPFLEKELVRALSTLLN